MVQWLNIQCWQKRYPNNGFISSSFYILPYKVRDDGDYEGWKYCTRRIIGDWVIARMPLVTQNDHDDNHDGDINDDHYDVPCDLWCNNDEEEKEEVMSYSP